MTRQEPTDPIVDPVVDPVVDPSVTPPETSAEGIARLGRDKMDHHPVVGRPLQVTAESLTISIAGLREELTKQGDLFTKGIERLNARKGSKAAVIGLYGLWILDIVLTAAVIVVGYRSEHFLTCQLQQNAEFRQAATTERAAQRRLFDTVLNPASTDADRHKASQDYYTGLIAADQQRTDVGAC